MKTLKEFTPYDQIEFDQVLDMILDYAFYMGETSLIDCKIKPDHLKNPLKKIDDLINCNKQTLKDPPNKMVAAMFFGNCLAIDIQMNMMSFIFRMARENKKIPPRILYNIVPFIYKARDIDDSQYLADLTKYIEENEDAYTRYKTDSFKKAYMIILENF